MKCILVFLALISSFVTASTLKVENLSTNFKMVPYEYYNREDATYEFTSSIAPLSRGTIEFDLSHVMQDASPAPLEFKYTIISYRGIIDKLTIMMYACSSPSCADSVYWKAHLSSGNNVKIAQSDDNKGSEVSLQGLSKSNLLTIKDNF
ncbi:MAG: hypothetical protein HON78_01925 [Legionellales bacterium]|jgi:hypothetical protein|nr:hypothetical protein [Legionellales bacterium]